VFLPLFFIRTCSYCMFVLENRRYLHLDYPKNNGMK
jgi:hypothetical protein